jgi:hypothetical protein
LHDRVALDRDLSPIGSTLPDVRKWQARLWATLIIDDKAYCIRDILQDTIHRLPTRELKIMPADAERKLKQCTENLVVNRLIKRRHGSLLEGLGKCGMSVTCSCNICIKVSGCCLEYHRINLPSELAPYSSARVPSAIISPAFEPMMWMPNILSVVASESIFTKPSLSRVVFALELAEKGNCPVLYLTPAALSSCSF